MGWVVTHPRADKLACVSVGPNGTANPKSVILATSLRPMVLAHTPSGSQLAVDNITLADLRSPCTMPSLHQRVQQGCRAEQQHGCSKPSSKGFACDIQACRTGLGVRRACCAPQRRASCQPHHPWVCALCGVGPGGSVNKAAVYVLCVAHSTACRHTCAGVAWQQQRPATATAPTPGTQMAPQAL